MGKQNSQFTVSSCMLLVVIFLSCFFIKTFECLDNLESYVKKENPMCTNANVPPEIYSEIESYRPVVEKISDLIVNGSYKGQAYKNVTEFLDTFGARLTGSKALEEAIDHVLATMNSIGLEYVHSEDVTAPKWVRGQESLQMIKPYKKNMQVLGLLPTVQTPEEGITSEVVVIQNYSELHENVGNVLDRVKGKILVLNHAWDDPVTAVTYRHKSAIEGAKVGAVATLTRSYTTFSLASPHTGELHYDENVPAIPSAEITIEDAEFLERLYKKGVKVVLTLKLRNELMGDIITRNSIGDMKGASIPDEYVLISGHVDSWDVGQGALDDGFAVILSMMLPEVLKSLKLVPKRTIRTIVWSAEEISREALGAEQYVAKHIDELKRFSFFLEPDVGTIAVSGLLVNGSAEAICILSEILKLMEPNLIPKTTLQTPFPDLKTDVVPLMKATGVAGGVVLTDVNKYFWYHHSMADTVTALQPRDLDVCLAFITALSYVVADLSIMLPQVTALK